MGTPEFAVASLGALLMNGYNVCSVVTAPDKPAGRGRKLTPSPVKLFSELSNIPVIQPVDLTDSMFLEQVQRMAPDLIIVVAFRLLPEELWTIPRLGTFNLHASLLPQYRGAAPINHAIINGETTTGGLLCGHGVTAPRCRVVDAGVCGVVAGFFQFHPNEAEALRNGCSASSATIIIVSY